MKHGRFSIYLIVLLSVLSSFCVFGSAPNASASGDVTILDVTADRSMYAPGDTVTVTVRIRNESGKSIANGRLCLQPMHLNRQAGAASTVLLNLGSGATLETAMQWHAPSADFQGYLLHISALDSEGSVLAAGTVAVDVSSSWVKFPRYGYVWDFGASVNVPSKLEILKNYHINAIQYYDWQYRHQQPVSDDLAGWNDWTGRYISGNTVRGYIAQAKARNMANMAYNLIYGVTSTFDAKTRSHWGLYYAS